MWASSFVRLLVIKFSLPLTFPCDKFYQALPFSFRFFVCAWGELRPIHKLNNFWHAVTNWNQEFIHTQKGHYMLILVSTICGSLTSNFLYAKEETDNEAVTVPWWPSPPTVGIGISQMSVLKLFPHVPDTHCCRLGHCLTMCHLPGRYACCSHSVCNHCCKCSWQLHPQEFGSVLVGCSSPLHCWAPEQNYSSQLQKKWCHYDTSKYTHAQTVS